jgi:PAS domain S-box-containing protein
MKLSHDILLALAYVSQISDPNLVRSRFFESLNALDDEPVFTFTTQSPVSIPENRIFPIATIHSSFGYAVIDEIPDLNEDNRAVFRNAFQFLAVLLENREQAQTLRARNENFRKQAEESLASNDTLLRIAGETAKFGGWSVDLRNNICNWSDKVADIHEVARGYSPPVEDGINFYAPEWRDKITQVFTDCAEKGIPYDEEMEIITGKGRRAWVRTTGEAVRDESGIIIKVQGAFQDISDRKNAEIELQKSQQNYKLLLENQADMVVKVDAQGRFLFVSPSYCEMFGKKEEEILGQTFLPLVHEEDRAATERAMQSLYEPPHTAYMEQRAMTKKGWLWLAWVDTAVFDEQGNIKEIIGVGRDINERKLAEDAVRESERRLSTLMGNLPGMAYRCKNDERWTMEFVSSGCLPLTGYEPKKIMNNAELSYAELVHPDDWDRIFQEVRKGVENQQPFLMEYRIRDRAGNERWVWEQGREVDKDKAGREILEGFIMDISERINAEEALRDSETRFRLLAESAPVGIVISDRDQRTIYVSKRFVELFGYTMEDMPSVEAWWPLAYPDKNQRENIKKQWDMAIQEAQNAGTNMEPMEFPVTCKDGTIRHIEFRLAFAGDLNFVIFIDVSERKTMEIELKQTNIILSQLLEVANQLTLARNADDVVQTIKTAARRLIGADGVAVVIRDGDMCHYVDEDAVSPLWKGKRFRMEDCISGWVMQHRKNVVVEDITIDPRIPYELYRPTFVKSLAFSPIRSKNPIGAIGAYWAGLHKATDAELSLLNALCDMTDSVWDAMEKEKSLIERDELQRAIVESSPLPVFSLDLNGNVLTWNTSAEKIFGWHAEEVIDKPLPIVSKDKTPEFESLLNRVKSEGGFTGHELVRRKKSGEFINISLSTAPIHDEQKHIIGIVATVEDITERKKAEKELHRLKDHLEQEVALKTRELKERVAELERFHDATIEREFRIKELRDEIDRLKSGDI